MASLESLRDTQEREETSKTFEIKGINSEIFLLEFVLEENSISIISKKKFNLNCPMYFLNLDLKKFQEIHKFFYQYPDIKGLFELIKDLKEDELYLKDDNNNLILILKIEQRKTIIEIPFKLTRKELDLNNSKLNENTEKFLLKSEFNTFKEKILNQFNELYSKISNLEKENKELKEYISKLLESNNQKDTQLFSESKIILNDDNKNFLKYCLNKTTMKTKLIYSATIDGDNIVAFNKKCDGKDNTLTIIKTDNGKIIGGFFKRAFSVKEDYYDPDCFLFSLNYGEMYIVNPNGSKKNYSFYGTGSSSAIIDFGYGSSIHIVDNCLSSDSNYYCGREETFKFPKNRITSSDIHFKVNEFEVYQIS